MARQRVMITADNRQRAIIFLNGDRSDLSPIKKYITKGTLLIGCDGGTYHILALGYRPDVVIGDFDSFSGPNIDGTAYVRYPKDKDFTDSELAMRYAAQLKYREIILAGALGSRLDHVLGNIFILAKPAFARLNIKIIEGNQIAYLISGDAHIEGKKGDTISFIPITGNVRIASTTGLKYNLSKYRLSLKGNLGISNVMTRKTARIVILKGSLLAVHHDGPA